MTLIIQDGTGTGQTARVTPANRVSVAARVRQIISQKAQEEGEVFALGLPFISVDATVNGRVLWLRNDDPIKLLAVERYVTNWDGGTSGNVIKWQLFGQDQEPTANNTTVTPVNTNRSSGMISNVTAYRWNGVGTGMTVVAGTPSSTAFIIPGRTITDAAGISVLGRNDVISVNLDITKAGESGEVSANIIFYLINPTQE